MTELRVICETAGESKKHPTLRPRALIPIHRNHSRKVETRISSFTKFEALCTVLFLVNMSKYHLLNKFKVTPIHSLRTLAYLQYVDVKERVGRRENDQYGNYAHSTVHDTFTFLSLNMHVRAVSDIAIYISRIELPNLHIQGHNCHFPEPSHLVAIHRTLLPLLSYSFHDELF